MTTVPEITEPDEVRTPGDDDIALLQAAKEGGITAFERLVMRHEPRMFQIAKGLLRNREDAQDAVQEAFLKAFQKLDQFQAQSKFSPWLTRITVNEALTKLRKYPVYRGSLENEFRDGDEANALPVEIAGGHPNPEMLYTASELSGILEKNLQRLRPGLRAVFLLRDLEGLSLKETAQSLGLSLAAVKSRSSRARLQLREWLSRSGHRVFGTSGDRNRKPVFSPAAAAA